MKLELLSLLRCPLSHSHLELEIIDSVREQETERVETGILLCRESQLWYPIINFVPVMLTFKTQLTEKFAQRHADVLSRFDGYRMPDEEPMPGERSVQRTFTEEWSGLGADEVTFVYTDDELLKLHRDVWLHLPPTGDAAPRTVLDIGCGFGREAVILSKIFPNAEVVGVDLNLSLLEAAPTLLSHGRLQFVTASLFRLPFSPLGADHVHCNGVIHHTFSTKQAFESLAPLARVGGTLFVWVYGREDYQIYEGLHGFLVRLYAWVSHRIGRPVLSRLPPVLRNPAVTLLTAVLHPIFKLRSRHRDEWQFANSLHTVRDAFTPRYAHLHRFNEVLTWFEDCGYSTQPQSPARYRDLTGKSLLGIGVVGRKLDGDPS